MERWIWYAFLTVPATAAVIVPRSELQSLTATSLGWLALSGDRWP